MRLTPTGARLRDRAGQILRDLETARQEVLAESGVPIGEVRIGATPAAVALLGADLIERSQKAAPQVRPSFLEGYSGYLQSWVLTGTVDFALVNGFEPSNPLLSRRSLARERLVAVGGPEGDDGPVRFAELLDAPLILPSAANPTRGLIDAAAKSLGHTVTTRLDVDSATLLKDLAASGYGVTILPFAAVAREARAGRLTARPIIEPDIPCDLNLIFRRDRPPSKLADMMIRLIVETLGEMVLGHEAAGMIELRAE